MSPNTAQAIAHQAPETISLTLLPRNGQFVFQRPSDPAVAARDEGYVTQINQRLKSHPLRDTVSFILVECHIVNLLPDGDIPESLNVADAICDAIDRAVSDPRGIGQIARLSSHGHLDLSVNVWCGRTLASGEQTSETTDDWGVPEHRIDAARLIDSTFDTTDELRQAPDQHKRERHGLEQDNPEDSGELKDDTLATTKWTERVRDLFAELPEPIEERFKMADAIRTAVREELAKVLSERIAESFKGRFDESNHPVETAEEMKEHSAQIRQWLLDWDFALTNPKTGKACQPFMRSSTDRRSYTLGPLGGRTSHVEKLNVVASALQSPKISDRPDPTERAFGKARSR